MFPSIPDKIYKLIIAIGLILAVFFYLEDDKVKNQIFKNDDKIFELSNNLDTEYLKSEKHIKQILKKSKDISKFYGIENAIERLNDSTVTFVSYIYSNDKTKQRFNDSLVKLWDAYSTRNNELDYKKSNIGNKIVKLNNLNNELTIANVNNKLMSFVGFLIFLFGLLLWILEETLEEKKKSISRIEDKIYSNCQSCGMKFSSVRNYGTNNNKTNSIAFCEDCFQNGEFTELELTLEQVKLNAKPYLKGNFFRKKLQLNSFNKLERFNRNKYFN